MDPHPSKAPERQRARPSPGASACRRSWVRCSPGLAPRSACSSSVLDSTPRPRPATTSIVKPPPVILQGCTYASAGPVPAGEPQGLQPPFAAFTPDQAGQAALDTSRTTAGRAGRRLPAPGGTKLYAGPDTVGRRSRRSIPGRSPDPSSTRCCGPTSSGAALAGLLPGLRGRQPLLGGRRPDRQADPAVQQRLVQADHRRCDAAAYTTTGHASSLPVIDRRQRQLRLEGPHGALHPARG